MRRPAAIPPGGGALTFERNRMITALHLTTGAPLARPIGMGGIAALTGPAFRALCAERLEQVERHGFTAAHDARHVDGEIAQGALAYLLAGMAAALGMDDDPRATETLAAAFNAWPFAGSGFRTGTPSECFIKAAAMLLAEVDRIEAQDAATDLFTPSPQEKDQ